MERAHVLEASALRYIKRDAFLAGVVTGVAGTLSAGVFFWWALS